LVDDFACVVDQ